MLIKGQVLPCTSMSHNNYNLFYFPGSRGGFPAFSHYVHKVHSNIPKAGGVLRSGSAPAETSSPASRLGWRLWPRVGAENRNGQPRVLGVPFLR